MVDGALMGVLPKMDVCQVGIICEKRSPRDTVNEHG